MYKFLQKLNGIFFIPVDSIILAGFFLPKISALAAKVALLTGLAFYITCTFIFNVNLHFVHIWGIEFILNMIVMILISYNFPDDKEFKINHDILEGQEKVEFLKGAEIVAAGRLKNLISFDFFIP